MSSGNKYLFCQKLMRTWALVALLIALCAGCARQLVVLPPDDVPLQPPDGYFPRGEWRTSTPEEQGLDSEALASIFTMVETEHLPIHSLQIVRYGHLVLNAYFFPFMKDERHDVASITKSITSTLVGMALDRKLFAGLETPVYPLLETAPHDDVLKQQIHLRHLLTNSSGLDCGRAKFEQETLAMAESENWVRFTLDLLLYRAPGKSFSYCSPGFHLLSALITRRTGMTEEDFARRDLFMPLGITDLQWPHDPQGLSQGSGGLQMRPSDVLKFGYLFLRGGEWDGWWIISRRWIEEATRQQIETPYREGYGFGWWVSHDVPGMYLATGRGGQRLIVWPAKDIVAVITAGGLDPAQLAPLLLRAVKSNDPIPQNPAAYARLMERVGTAATPAQQRTAATPLPSRATEINNRVYSVTPNLLGVEAIEMRFHDQSRAHLHVKRKNDELLFPIGLDSAFLIDTDPASGERLAGRGQWTAPDELKLELDMIGRINHFTLILRYDGDRLHGSIGERGGLVPDIEIAGRLQR